MQATETQNLPTCNKSFFFDMQSCQYAKVKGKQSEQRSTDILCLRNLRLFIERELLNHNNPALDIQKQFQQHSKRKGTKRNNTVTITQHRLGVHQYAQLESGQQSSKALAVQQGQMKTPASL